MSNIAIEYKEMYTRTKDPRDYFNLQDTEFNNPLNTVGRQFTPIVIIIGFLRESGVL